jgi:hypothetical protein
MDKDSPQPGIPGQAQSQQQSPSQPAVEAAARGPLGAGSTPRAPSNVHRLPPPPRLPPPHPHPSKEEVRAWLARRSRTGLPPPAPDEIRRELHWHLLPAGTTPPVSPLLLPAMLAELAMLTLLSWYMLALRPGQSMKCQ